LAFADIRPAYGWGRIASPTTTTLMMTTIRPKTPTPRPVMKDSRIPAATGISSTPFLGWLPHV
jgi:hypothetical protein